MREFCEGRDQGSDSLQALLYYRTSAAVMGSRLTTHGHSSSIWRDCALQSAVRRVEVRSYYDHTKNSGVTLSYQTWTSCVELTRILQQGAHLCNCSSEKLREKEREERTEETKREKKKRKERKGVVCLLCWHFTFFLFLYFPSYSQRKC